MLYQYASWQEKDDANRTKKNIQGSKLYFNTVKNFNDPFDSSPSYNVSSESRKSLINRFEKETRGKYGNGARNIPASAFNKIFKSTDYNKFSNAKRGITCFSRDNANILMWSHYADKHSGVCLGFDIDEQDEHLEKFFDESKNRHLFPHGRACRLLPIEYVSFDKRPSIDISDEEDSCLMKILTYKSDLWKYEQEVRIIVHSYDQMFFPRTLYYRPNCLKEIICGANMTLKTFIRLKNFVEKLPTANNISIFVATLSETSYELTIKKLDTESLQLISKNYCGLCSPDEIFTHDAINELKEIHRIGERKIKQCWNESLDNILIHRAISDFKFNELQIAEMVKHGGDARISIDSLQDNALSLFLDSMTDNIKVATGVTH